MSDPDEAARAAAAAAAVDLVAPGMTIGLGSGRAVWKVVELLGARDEFLKGGVRVVAASSRTDEMARSEGIQVVELDGSLELDLALDGADEVDSSLRLIKGGGGALLREKIVVAAARRFVVVAQSRKRAIEAGGVSLASLQGRKVRIRGFVEERGGPRIEARTPAQIEIVE